MNASRWIAAFAITLAFGCGTGEQSVETPAENREVSKTTATENKAPPSKQAEIEGSTNFSPADPTEVATQFMQAIKDGDQEKASDLLTTAAQKEAERSGLEVAPPGSQTARFSVGEVRYLDEAKSVAYVASMWSEQFEKEQPETEEVVWIVRKEKSGWRVAGMSTQVFEDAPPLVLNFEDHADMERKQQLVAEEMMRRASPDAAKTETLQAQKPVDSSRTLR